jgi:hypothetical protein
MGEAKNNEGVDKITSTTGMPKPAFLYSLTILYF